MRAECLAIGLAATLALAPTAWAEEQKAPAEKKSAVRVDAELREALAANPEMVGGVRVGVGAYRPLYEENGRVWGNGLDFSHLVMKGMRRIGMTDLVPTEDAEEELDYTVLWEYAGDGLIEARIFKGLDAVYDGRMPYLPYDPKKAVEAAEAAKSSDAPKFRLRAWKPSRVYTEYGNIEDIGEWAAWMIAADALGVEDPDAGETHVLEFATFDEAATYADYEWPVEVPPGEHVAGWTVGRSRHFVGAGSPEETVIHSSNSTTFIVKGGVLTLSNLTVEYRGEGENSAIYLPKPDSGYKGGHVILANVELSTRGKHALTAEHHTVVTASGSAFRDSNAALYFESRSFGEFESCRFLRNEWNSTVKNGARAVFRDCAFEGTSVSLTEAREVLFDACSFVGCKWNGIYANASPNVVVRNSSFKNAKENGVFAEKGARVVVKSCTFKGSGEHDMAWKSNGKVVEE